MTPFSFCQTNPIIKLWLVRDYTRKYMFSVPQSGTEPQNYVIRGVNYSAPQLLLWLLLFPRAVKMSWTCNSKCQPCHILCLMDKYVKGMHVCKVFSYLHVTFMSRLFQLIISTCNTHRRNWWCASKRE